MQPVPHEPESVTADPTVLPRIADMIPSMLAYWDSNLHCRFANRAYQRWFGVSPESLIGTHISNLLGPLYRLNLPYIEAALRGEPQEFEREIPDPAGGPSRHSLANYIPDVIGGSVRGFIALVTDISELKRTALALRTSEARFSGIVSVAQDAIITMDENRCISIFNAGAEAIFGYASSEVLGASLDILLPERLRQVHREHIAAFAAEPGTVTRRMGHRAGIVGLRKNGEEFPAEASISKFEVGGTKLLTVALRDITERERTDREQKILAEAGAVLASSLDYAKTLERIAKLVVQSAADLCVIDMIEQHEKVERLTVAHRDPSKAEACAKLAKLALSSRNTLSRSAIETQRPQIFADMTPEFLRNAASSPEHLALLEELAPRSAIVAPLVSTTGVIGALVLASSQPHRYQPRDLTLAMELARRASIAIENARLYEAARLATRTRDNALAIVAHDVRNPIATIHLAAKVLERTMTRGGPPDGESVQVILRAAKRANRLIQDLLDITRIEGGALSLAEEAIIPKQVVTEAWESLRLLASSASIALEVEISEDLPLIWADRHRLLQVFENLIGNAIKYTPRGGRVTIGAEPGRDEVLFFVRDTGPGIPVEEQPRVFDRFWQAQRADRKGAGLGLSICKGIVEAHGGRIRVESTPGRGSTFYFTVPTVRNAVAIQERGREPK